jgi:hypothetical protein
VPEYLTSILQILDYGLKTNSYKFALLGALAEVRPMISAQLFVWACSECNGWALGFHSPALARFLTAG